MKSRFRSLVTGAVLVGGKSRRFGSNKALFVLGDRPMARVVADLMRAAEIEDVFVVGDSEVTADLIGFPWIADSFPGDGPLGGLISAMRGVSTGVLCILPCDVPQIRVGRIRQLVDAIINYDEIDMAVLATSREHWLCSTWRVSTCLPVLEGSFAAGERAIHRAVEPLVQTRISATDAEMVNINTQHEALEVGRTRESGD